MNPAMLVACSLPAVSALVRYTLFRPKRLPFQPPFVGSVSILVPARNEETNLEKLLSSLPKTTSFSCECIVIDDASTDRSAEVAARLGAKVVAAPPLPGPEWTGKNWACHVGSQVARGEVLIFLDADTQFEPGGLERILAHYASLPSGAALSLLPYYESRSPTEELSAFFYAAIALGSGSFARESSSKRLFGPSLVVDRRSYDRIGGHAAVRSRILENFFMSEQCWAYGVHVECALGRDLLRVRMFPEGLRQLADSWTKAFVVGAGAAPGAALFGVIAWISALFTALLLLGASQLGAVAISPLLLLAVHLVLALQLHDLWRRLGNFSILTALAYPVPLLFYQGIFLRGLKRLVLKQKVEWRGRNIEAK